MTVNEVLEIKAKIMEVAQSKGVDIILGEDDMISLLDKIKNASTFSPENAEELGEIVYDWASNKITKENKQYYTNNPITIYTPSANYLHYCIRQRSDNNTYAIVWTVYDGFRPNYATTGSFEVSGVLIYANYISNSKGYGVQKNSKLYLYADDNPYNTSTYNIKQYVSPAYNTLAEAITAIQNPSTTYTSWTVTNFASISTGPIYSNGEYVSRRAFFNNQLDFDDIYIPTPISPNETIEVIQ